MKKIISLILLFAFGFAHAETASQMPTKIQMPWATNAGSSYKRVIPVPSQIGIQNGAASWNDGFPPLNFTPIAAGGVPPYGQDTNGVLNAISALTWWYSAGGPINYDSTFQTAIGGYPKGAIIQSAVTVGLLWVNTVDNNLTNPDASGAGWTSYTPQYATNATNATNANNLNRPGWIFDFGGSTCPSGTLTVGTTAATVSRTTYAALFAAIGTTWGAGDGSTTFNLPVILADQVTVQANGNVGTATVGVVIAHTHTIYAGLNGNNNNGPYLYGTSNVSPAPNVTTNSTGGSYNLAAGVRVMKCIQY